MKCNWRSDIALRAEFYCWRPHNKRLKLGSVLQYISVDTFPNLSSFLTSHIFTNLHKKLSPLLKEPIWLGWNRKDSKLGRKNDKKCVSEKLKWKPAPIFWTKLSQLNVDILFWTFLSFSSLFICLLLSFLVLFYSLVLFFNFFFFHAYPFFFFFFFFFFLILFFCAHSFFSQQFWFFFLWEKNFGFLNFLSSFLIYLNEVIIHK